jgi:hypothetical protein
MPPARLKPIYSDTALRRHDGDHASGRSRGGYRRLPRQARAALAALTLGSVAHRQCDIGEIYVLAGLLKLSFAVAQGQPKVSLLVERKGQRRVE